MMTTISIHVDDALAESFLHASDDRKHQLVTHPQRFLLSIADEIGEYATSQGMSAEILELLLRD